MQVSVEELDLLKDSKYRTYSSQIEKALRSFENTTEWPDLISALVKLTKVISSHIKYPVIPKHTIVGKRLAQCLHPALPSGVHLKALETYDVIFKCIGPNRLAGDLFTYCSGLFPLLGYAATNVKSSLLELYTHHFVPLGRHVKPALPGLLLALLPGLEEGSEHADSVSQLLEEFCQAAECSVFYTCLWQCLATNSSIRQPGLTFVLQHLNKKQSMDDQLHLMGNDINLLVDALCACVNDANVLVQRSVLDLLLLGYPMDASPLTKADLCKVTTAALKVVLRRDMSLNRRLYGWLTGDQLLASATTSPSEDSMSINSYEHELDYFNLHCRELLITAFRGCLNQRCTQSVLYPFRILTSLLDRPEIGGVILDEVFMDLMHYLRHRYQALDVSKAVCKSDERTSVADLIKHANLFVSSMESNYLWGFLAKEFDRCCVRGQLPDLCELVEFLLKKISLDSYMETRTRHLPSLLEQVLYSLRQHRTSLPHTSIVSALRLCASLLRQVQPTLVSPDSLGSPAHTHREGLTSDLIHTDHLDLSSYSTVSAFSYLRQFLTDFLKSTIFVDPSEPVRLVSLMMLSPSELGLSSSALSLSCRLVSSRAALKTCGDDVCDVVKCLCELFMDFSAFPLYCSNNRVGGDKKNNHKIDLPEWIVLMQCCSCFVMDLRIQMPVIQTMLDLISLVQSLVTSGSPQQGERDRKDKVSVLLLPPLSVAQLDYLSKNTCYLGLLAHRLWHHLAPDCTDQHQLCVQLLHQLHQLTPDPWLCEDIIGTDLTHRDTARQRSGFQKFTVLWQLLKDVQHSIGRPVRTFDRSLMLLLETLSSTNHPCHSLAQIWFSNAIQRGDIMRVLEPLLLILLHPDTARVSIQHVNITSDPEPLPPDYHDSDTHIYAISSEGGHVIYHVNQPHQTKPVRPVTYAMTSVNQEGHSSTHRAAGLQALESELSFDKVDPSKVKLTMNPFGAEGEGHLEAEPSNMSLTSESTSLLKAHRLDSEICRREGIFFDDDLEDFVQEAEEMEQPAVDPYIIIESLLEEVLNSVVQRVNAKNSLGRLRLSSLESSNSLNHLPDDLLTCSENHFSDGDTEDAKGTTIHPLHSHILIYSHCYDADRTMFALNCLKAMLSSNPRLFTCALSTTSLGSTQTPHAARLNNLLIRHRRAVFGKNFFSDIPGDNQSSFKNLRLLEVLLSLCLYFVRSYYPNLLLASLSEDHLAANKQVQILSCEVLSLLLEQTRLLCKDSGSGYATYTSDLLSRCRLQKAILHCVLAYVYSASTELDVSLTQTILAFNDNAVDTTNNETFLLRLLHLIQVLVVLEDTVKLTLGHGGVWESKKSVHVTSLSKVRYAPGELLVSQAMLLTGVVCALKQHHCAHLHQHWLHLIISIVPYLGTALPEVLTAVVRQLCRNLQSLATVYQQGTRHSLGSLPPDHIVSMLESLTALCHYCLLDSPAQDIYGAQQAPTGTTVTVPTLGILSSLVSLFVPQGRSREASPDKDVSADSPGSLAKAQMTSQMPYILVCVLKLWQAVHGPLHVKQQSVWILGTPKAITQRLMDLISPITRTSPVAFLGAVAVVWNDRSDPTNSKILSVLPGLSSEQNELIDLVNNIKVLPLDSVITTVTQVLKQPPITTSQDQNRTSIEDASLQFFLGYLKKQDAGPVLHCSPSLLTFFKEATSLTLAPATLFVVCGILYEVVQKIPMNEDRKLLKDFQDVSQKCVESLIEVTAEGLEQKSILNRQLVVKAGRQDADSPSVASLALLAEITAPLLDILYRSEEKDKVIPLLGNLMNYTLPYLKHHSEANLPSIHAASLLLCNLSEYQYTRRAWKTQALDLLLDMNFFQLDLASLTNWHTVVDSLMTHDRTTFKELLSRTLVTPTATLNPFSSRQQEYQLRAAYLRRLAFTLYCSQLDQYAKSMPDIQERLSDNLRLSSVPSVQSHILLCFRVLVLRISPQHLTSLWPTIITELVQALVIIEEEVHSSIKNSEVHRVRPHTPDWLQLFLSAAKLLDLAMSLPSDQLPQFQLYKWAFTGDGVTENSQRREQQVLFVPHLKRIDQHMTTKFGSCDLELTISRPLLRMTSINSLCDLQPFFHTLLTPDLDSCDGGVLGALSRCRSEPALGRGHTSQSTGVLETVEELLLKDFLETFPAL